MKASWAVLIRTNFRTNYSQTHTHIWTYSLAPCGVCTGSKVTFNVEHTEIKKSNNDCCQIFYYHKQIKKKTRKDRRRTHYISPFSHREDGFIIVMGSFSVICNKKNRSRNKNAHVTNQNIKVKFSFSERTLNCCVEKFVLLVFSWTIYFLFVLISLS